MIKKFFRALEVNGVDYMLISGQASVLYGAATFSEDIDLWVQPTADNWKIFVKALGEVNATIYKLTPPISSEFINKGHGFHFKIPGENGGNPCFLDVMGVPPRVDSFGNCWKNVSFLHTEWGRLPVISVRDLVELKKTRRLEDYPVISNLVKIAFDTRYNKDADELVWILQNSFNLDDIIS